ncbi:hypothetical protein Cgig2_021840 [Carnegiea gigantea]|uniref:Uncharacterized protein n=1 Tax=Carnegiea gigantea TaxID=171969 RepID=A0A9Q1Q3Q6_9CARY|nr:hypothetical protein Cgig2_021840 [Carnegiea gigantea]
MKDALKRKHFRDQSAKLWDVKTGKALYTFVFDSPARSVDFSVGDKLAVTTADPFIEKTSAIHVKRIAADIEDQTDESVLVMKGPRGRINRAVWGPLNKFIISAGEDAIIHGSHFLTGSLDKSAKVVLGGGQDASAVTSTDHRAGKFEAKFYDKAS